MIASINQPAYLPWLGYFHRIAVSDVHIVLDHVQFEKNSFTNRNKIRTKDGWQWLTVPVKTKGRFGNLSIQGLEINGTAKWEKKHWNAIQLHYGRTSYFGQHAAFFEDLYCRHWIKINDLIRESTRYLLEVLGIRTRLLFSSKMRMEGKKNDLLLNICRAVEATHYLSGPLGRDYLNAELFEERGIHLTYHDYKHPIYPQAYPGFESRMSVVDLLFNCGPESFDVLMRNQEKT